MFFLVVLLVLVYIAILLYIDCDLGLAWAEKYGKPLETLAGKVVWITGASSGIGEHIAISMAHAGAKLVLSARREDELQRVKRNCLKIGKGITEKDILVVPMDVLKVHQHKQHLQDVLDHFGKLDILVNNAGRSQRANWEDIDLQVDREMFDLNVFGVLSLSRLALQYFLKQKKGHIVVTSSLAGFISAPFSASYTGAKYAIHGYFNALRLEKMLTNIKVTLLCPGPVFSNFLSESFTDKPGEKFGKSVEASDKRMTAERCGHLCAVAIANELDEAWMALPPIIPLCYMFRYYPLLSSYFIRYMGPRFFLKLRDSKVKMEVKSD